MNKISLEELKNSYRDQTQVSDPSPVAVPVVKSVEIESASVPNNSDTKSNAPIYAFLSISGFAMLTGVFMMVSSPTNSVGTVHDELVLGESVVVEDREYAGTDVQAPVEESLDQSEQEDESEIDVIEKLQMVRILSNEYNGVNLRVSPNGVNKARAISGEEFELISESDGWTEIRFDENTTYWVKSNLVEKL